MYVQHSYIVNELELESILQFKT